MPSEDDARPHDGPPTGPAAPAAHQTGPRVLLVENDPGEALVLRGLLADATTADEAGIECTWVQSLADARTALDASIECILVDLELPDAPGIEALTEVLGFAGDAAVIALTGIDDPSLGAQSVQLGAQDHLAKASVDPRGLARAIRYSIGRKRGAALQRRLHDADSHRAENVRLERGLLPRPLIRTAELRWATRYAPSGGQGLLGGDFYDAVELADGTIRLVVGDVCGHGPDEAAVGVALRVAWRTLVLAGVPPHELLPHLESVLVAERHAEHIFTTTCDVVLRPDLASAEVRMAGHPGPFRIDDGCVGPEVLDRRGPLLGVFPDARWEPSEIELGRDWTWMLYTDGLIEGFDRGTGERLETEGLARIAEAAMTEAEHLGALADRVRADVEHANGGPLDDDLAMFLFSPAERWHP